MATAGMASIPQHFNAKNAAKWEYRPDMMAVMPGAEEWRRANNIRRAGSDKFRIHVLVIDAQKDFCFPEGTLYVGGRSGTGAIDDSVRMAEFIYRNAPYISDITTTMDTHFAFQIFFSPFWMDEHERPLSPHTLIRAEGETLMNLDLAGNVIHKNVKPIPAVAKWVCNGNYTWLLKQVAFYSNELQRVGKYPLYLWPPHCLLGGDGHALVGVLHEARMTHAFARGVQSNSEIKGGHPLTENFSVFRPEVLTRFDSQPLAQKNTRFIRTIFQADASVVMGQADSHCVKSTIEDLLTEIVAMDPSLAKKVYVATDCMSSVTVPDGSGGFLADFTPDAEKAHQKFADAGMHLVKSTDPIQSWPGIRL